MRSSIFLILSFTFFGLGPLVYGQTAVKTTELKNYELAAEYSREHNGAAMLVVKGDKVVFEDYATEGAKDTPWFLASGTKSFSGVLCAAAIEDKLITSFDEKVADTITEWKTDARKSKITIRQLLTLTSGIEAGQIGFVPSYTEAIKRPASHEPGTYFEYGPVPFQIFGEIMTRKLKGKNETVMSYLKRRILDPIGLQVGSWRKFGDQPLLPQGASLTAREWAKFGVLVKNRGKWNDKQIIDAKLLDELVVGTKANPAYGITFWLNAKGTGASGNERQAMAGAVSGDKPPDVFMAAGIGNQRLFVIRSLDLVIVRFGLFGGWDDREFISKLITGK